MKHYTPPQNALRPKRVLHFALLLSYGLVVIAIGLIFMGAGFEIRGADHSAEYFVLYGSSPNAASMLKPFCLLVASGLLAEIAWKSGRIRDPHSHRWVTLAILFATLTVDTTFGIHAVIMEPMLQSPLGRWAVVVPLIPAAALAAYLFPMLLDMQPSRSLQFVLCATVFAGAALLGEVLGAFVEANFGRASLQFTMASFTEEALEIMGASSFCVTLAMYSIGNFNETKEVDFLG